ncbi:hypothetical protein J1614_000833, partial [Plenodomus biglobosus]
MSKKVSPNRYFHLPPLSSTTNTTTTNIPPDASPPSPRGPLQGPSMSPQQTERIRTALRQHLTQEQYETVVKTWQQRKQDVELGLRAQHDTDLNPLVLAQEMGFLTAGEGLGLGSSLGGRKIGGAADSGLDAMAFVGTRRPSMGPPGFRGFPPPLPSSPFSAGPLLPLTYGTLPSPSRASGFPSPLASSGFAGPLPPFNFPSLPPSYPSPNLISSSFPRPISFPQSLHPLSTSFHVTGLSPLPSSSSNTTTTTSGSRASAFGPQPAVGMFSTAAPPHTYTDKTKTKTKSITKATAKAKAKTKAQAKSKSKAKGKAKQDFIDLTIPPPDASPLSLQLPLPPFQPSQTISSTWWDVDFDNGVLNCMAGGGLEEQGFGPQ